jgi:hypothetical protein
MVNLEDARKPVQERIESSLMSFASEKPDLTWCTFALYVCPRQGWATTNFDTAAKSAQIVAEFGAKGPGWCGEDEWGQFNDNCPDFEFCEWHDQEFPEWEREYWEREEAQPMHVRDLSGHDHFISSDEALNGLVCRFLRTVLSDQLGVMKESPFFPRARHRFGVQLLDSQFSEFWRSQDVIS